MLPQGNVSNVNSERKSTVFPLIAASLTFIASFFALALSLLYFSAASMSLGYHPGYINGLNMHYLYYLATGIFGAISYVFGVVSAFSVFKRKRLRFSLFGLGLLVVCGVVMLFPIFFFGLPLLVLSVLAVGFFVVSKNEFT